MGNKQTQIENFKKQWLNKKWTENEMFNIYIANPFCIKHCKYCIYKPIITQVNSELYKKYYHEYLKNMIILFKDVLSMRVADTIYFGGGTASFMSTSTMRDIFESIPHFRDIPYKNFECNPSILSLDKLKLLAEYNFTYVSFGIQSLDENVLTGQNRLYYDIEKLGMCIEFCKGNNMMVNCDLLAYMETGSLIDLDTLEHDLSEVDKLLKPDIITVYPMYQRLRTSVRSYTDMAHNYKYISNLRKTMKKFIDMSSYHMNDMILTSLDREDILKYGNCDYFLLNIPNSKFAETRKYNSSAYPNNPLNQNVLALGGYGYHQPYSYMSNKKYWYMINNNWNLEIYEKIIG